MDNATFARAYGHAPPAQREPTPPTATDDPVWHVYLDGRLIDRVCIYAPGCSADMVKRDLLHHGGYDARITVSLGGKA